MNIKNKNNKNIRKKINIDYIYMLPIILILSIIPLIVRMKILPLNEVLLYWTGVKVDIDFFSYYKAIFIILTGVLSLILIFFQNTKDTVFSIKEKKKYYITTVMYTFFIGLSVFFSEYKRVSIYGGPQRYEGIFVLFSYILILLYAVTINKSRIKKEVYIYCISFCLIIMGIVGYFQYIDKDLFMTDYFKSIIIPSDYTKYIENMEKPFYNHIIYGTLYHYNYIGSLTGMTIPLFLSILIFSNKIKMKILSLAILAISTFILVGSTARSGVIAVTISILVFMMFIFDIEIIRKHKKNILILIIPLILLSSVFIFTKSSEVRNLNILEELKLSLRSQESNYREEIYLQDVNINDGFANITTKTEILRMGLEGNKIKFYDENFDELQYNKDESTKMYKLLSKKYDSYTIKQLNGLNDNYYINITNVSNAIDLMFEIKDNKIFTSNKNGVRIDLEDAKSIGFEGKEKLGSGRGYIWSRTFPLILERPLTGYGPDTFFIYFPQNDIFAKTYVYSDPWHLVDKPHNLYIQIAQSSGIGSLIAFLSIISLYIIDFIKQNIKTKHQEKDINYGFELGIFVAIIGYLVAGIFNDSAVSVAPIFWLLLGTGINLLKRNEKI